MSILGELCLDLSFFGAVGNKAAVTHTPDIAKIAEKTQEFESEGNKVDEEVKNVRLFFVHYKSNQSKATKILLKLLISSPNIMTINNKILYEHIDTKKYC